MEAKRPSHKAMAVRLIEARARAPFGAVVGQRRREGKTFRQIGAEYGVSAQTVWRHYRAYEETEKHASATP